MNIFEILKSKDSDNPSLKGCQVKDEITHEGVADTNQPVSVNEACTVADPVNIEDAFIFVGKSLAKSYRRGEISAKELLRSYRKNVTEVETFCTFGYKIQELREVIRTTHNPALKAKLKDVVEEKKALRQKSNLQNQSNLDKLDGFKSDVLGMGIGIRKVISSMRKIYKKTGDKNALIVSLLSETEFARM